MLLNDIIFASDGIAIISHLLTHLNPSYSENLVLAISDITCLEMKSDKANIEYMSRVCGIPQGMRGVLVEKTIPLFPIASLYHNHYPGMKSWYITGDPALVNFKLINLRGLIYSEDTRKQSLGFMGSKPTAKENHVSNAQVQTTPSGRLQPRPIHMKTRLPPMYYQPPRGGPLKVHCNNGALRHTMPSIPL